MNPWIAFFFCLFFALVQAQTAKNTSYHVNSEFEKQLKKFPNIEIVSPQSFPDVVEQLDVVYHAINDRNLHLDAYFKISHPKKPALILIHDGGWNSGDKSLMKPLAQYLGNQGFQCFAVEFRLLDEAVYPAAIDDVLTAVDFIVHHADVFYVDSKKIALLGCSSGGQMASLLGTKYGSMFKAVVNLDGILAFHHPESQEGLLASKWLGGNYETIPEVWNDASALFHVNQSMPPFLFINSQFQRFHAGRDDMILIMKNLHIDAQIKTIEHSPHTFWLFHPWFKITTQYITDFLIEKLKP
jgi:acetyl esterase/lipase